MKNIHKTNENGLTLVEILASIVILSLILISIVTVFNQSARTNKASETIIDATFVVQQEMETIYKLSQESVDINDLTEYVYQMKDGTWDIYHKSASGPYFLEIKLEDSESPMVRIVVSAYESTDINKTKKQAQMETLIKWGKDDESSS